MILNLRSAMLAVVCISLSTTLACDSPNMITNDKNNNPAQTTNPNQAILREANTANGWFHAKKVKPLWAIEVTEDGEVTTLEADEKISKEDFLCRGEAGDTWPQSAENLNKKYDATEEVNEKGWRKYVPKPDAAGVMAIQIDHLFEVQASWGELKGKSGDYLVKNFDDKDIEYPEDSWIVDKAIFNSTYQRVER